MEWFFDGLGTLLIGLVVGGGAGAAAGWNLAITRTKQIQKAGDHANQAQIIGDRNRQRNDLESET